MSDLGSTIKHWRDYSGKTLRDVAALVAADFTYLSKIEHGHDVPSRRLARELDQVLHADGAITAAWDETRCPTCGGRIGLGVKAPS